MYKLLLGLSVSGLLFSGYLSGQKLFVGACAFNEGCPYFLGYPACYFGFAMYLALTTLALLLYRGTIAHHVGRMGILFVSFLGILFAGYYSINELPLLFEEGWGAYALGLPSCAWGLIMYLALFGIALRMTPPTPELVRSPTEAE